MILSGLAPSSWSKMWFSATSWRGKWFCETWVSSSLEPADQRAIGSPAGAAGWPDRRECWLKGDWQGLAFCLFCRLMESLVVGWQSDRVRDSSPVMSMCHNANPVLWEWQQREAHRGGRSAPLDQEETSYSPLSGSEGSAAPSTSRPPDWLLSVAGVPALEDPKTGSPCGGRGQRSTIFFFAFALFQEIYCVKYCQICDF